MFVVPPLNVRYRCTMTFRIIRNMDAMGIVRYRFIVFLLLTALIIRPREAVFAASLSLSCSFRALNASYFLTDPSFRQSAKKKPCQLRHAIVPVHGQWQQPALFIRQRLLLLSKPVVPKQNPGDGRKHISKHGRNFYRQKLSCLRRQQALFCAGLPRLFQTGYI